MDWKTIAQQQQEIEQSFVALKQIFEQAEIAYKQRNAKLMEMFAGQIKSEAQNLSKIHSALTDILKASEIN